ncbi:MAG: ROK family protein [Clostridia bacterium]|nr:ROK family protein [Clostridia bacterium]
MFEEQEKAIYQHNTLIQILRLYPGLEKSKIAEKIDVSIPTLYKSLDDLKNKNIVDSDSNINPNVGTLMGISVGTSLCKVVFLHFDFSEYTHQEFQSFKKYFAEPSPYNIVLKDKATKDSNYICFETPNNFSDLKEQLNYIFEVIRTMILDDKLNLLSIGISSTGIIDEQKQIINQSHNLPYLEKRKITDFYYLDKKVFFQNYNIKLFLIQNSTAAVLSEKERLYKFDSDYKNQKNIAAIYLEYGLGAGFIIDGRLFFGANGYAGEIGHIAVPATLLIQFENLFKDISFDINSKCLCGSAGCFDHIMRSIVFDFCDDDFKNMNSDEMRTFLNSHPSKARFLGTLLGYITNILSAILNVDLVIFTGKLYKSMDLLHKFIEQTTDENNLKFNRGDCNVYASQIGTLSPAFGAAMYSFYAKYSINIEWK